MGGIFRSISVALAIAVLAGCGPKYDWEGEWTGTRDLKARPGEDETIVNTLNKIRLVIKPGGHFELLDSGLPKEGIARFEGKKAFLQTTKVMGRLVYDQKVTEITVEATGANEAILNNPSGLNSNPAKLRRSVETSGTSGK